ncbi:MAG TPA: cytochrome c oxidase subunit II [Mycobacterium sp.]|nr:cytochrome c oxidase subunit II [Mycobacterium sp.]
MIWLFFASVGGLVTAFFLKGHFPFVNAKQGLASDQAILILLFYACVDFFALVVPIVYSAVRWRERGGWPGEQGDSPVQRRSHRIFPAAWTSYALGIGTLAIIFPGVTGLLDIWGTINAKQQLVVNVTGKQWEWDFSYPASHVKSTDELVVPVGENIRFNVASADVDHSFWVPAWRVKWDAIPGEVRPVTFTLTRTASTFNQPLLRVQCAELCGAGHQDMQAVIYAVTPAQFHAWIRREQAQAAYKKALMKKVKHRNPSSAPTDL